MLLILSLIVAFAILGSVAYAYHSGGHRGCRGNSHYYDDGYSYHNNRGCGYR